jgi:hypothetical protein
MALHYVSIAIRKGTFNLDCLVVFGLIDAYRGVHLQRARSVTITTTNRLTPSTQRAQIIE